MTENMPDDDYQEQEPGPSLAIPPLYLLSAAARCPECGQALQVCTLGCAAFHDTEDLRRLNAFHFLLSIRSVPEPVLGLLQAKWSGYYLDQTEPQETPYLTNHCPCGNRLDDDYLHGDFGATLMPVTPEGYKHVGLFRLPVEEAIPVECTYVLGGGEYLDIEHAVPR